MKTPSIIALSSKVSVKEAEGLKRTGCQASAYDRIYYAAQVLFPEANDDAHHRMAEYALGEFPD